MRLMRLSASAAARERRLRELLGEQAHETPELREVLDVALARGSAALSQASDPDAARLREAWSAVPREAPFGREVLLAWHAAALPGGGRLRVGLRQRECGPPPAPPEFVAERVDALADWLGGPSAEQLGPAQQGALALARLVEIAPFDEGNARVSRLAAAHLMVRAGARPPLLDASDAERLRACLEAAFRLETEPLSALLQEASERCLDVLIRRLEG